MSIVMRVKEEPWTISLKRVTVWVILSTRAWPTEPRTDVFGRGAAFVRRESVSVPPSEISPVELDSASESIQASSTGFSFGVGIES